MDISILLIYGLATWRISSLLVQEEGPFHIFEKIRYWVGIQHEGMIPDNLLGGILSCVWCCSIWIALFWTISLWIIPKWSVMAAMPFAFSAIAILIDPYVRREN